MLKLDPTSKKLIPVSSTTLTQSNILERADLQAAIEGSWEAFAAELGFDELFLIGSELVPHDSCRDRIDLLGLSRGGTPVVFELKRDRDKLQLLQAISYAAMIAKWDARRYIDAIGSRTDDDAEELRTLLRDEDFELEEPEIVLLAESFDPEVILAADWLAGFEVPTSAFALTAVDYGGDTLISLDRKFPLPGVDDLYTRRSARASRADPSVSWDEAIKQVEFKFAKRAVEIFTRRIEGSPHRRAFNSIYAGSPLGRMSIAFKRRYLKVYTVDQSAEAEQTIRQRLEPIMQVHPWGNENTKNSGFTFTIETPEQFAHFLQAVGETDV